jgi:predicted Rossmann fold flavoprotein
MKRVVIAGGGAAGFFAAIACAQACALSGTKKEVVLLEHGAAFLTKVRVSGGGRCNVTHACEDVRELAAYYPRGGRALLAAFQRFGPAETEAWFRERGVKLKTEPDGRRFPVSDSSETIIDCFLSEARAAGVVLNTHCGLDAVARRPEGGFDLTLSDGRRMECEALLLALGGCRPDAVKLVESLGHSVEPPVPSLFTFRVETPWLRHLAGLSVEKVEVAVPSLKRREQGALLATHWGVSGPAILKLSAWGARALHGMDYRFPLHVNWLPERSREAIEAELQERAITQPAGRIVNTPLRPLPSRLWEQLVLAAGVAPGTRWGAFPRPALRKLAETLGCTQWEVSGKSSNKAEFVTCGGVRLKEVDLKTMQSRIVPDLFFAGELLDIDGLTGGFNFQAAWTTGWLAGRSMAEKSQNPPTVGQGRA